MEPVVLSRSVARPTNEICRTFTAFHPRRSQRPTTACQTVVPEYARRQLRSVLAAALIGGTSSVARCSGSRVERSSQDLESIEAALLASRAGHTVDAVAISVGEEHSDDITPYRCAVHVDGWIVTDAAEAHPATVGGAVPTDAPWLHSADAMCSHLSLVPLPDQRTFADLIVAEWADRLVSACLAGCGPSTAAGAYDLFPCPDDGASLSLAAFRSPDGPALARAVFDRLPDPEEIADLLPAIAPPRAREIIHAALIACAAHRDDGLYPIRLA